MAKGKAAKKTHERGEICTNRRFLVLCRRFCPVFGGNSARFAIFEFFAEDFRGFGWDFLHEKEFCVFLQKKHARAGEKFCINRGFAIFCRIPPGFGQKKSAQIGDFPFCAETCAVFSKNCLHKLHFSQSMQKIGLAGAGFQ